MAEAVFSSSSSSSSSSSKMDKPIFCAIEGGGTTWKCALVDGTSMVITEKVEFQTETPQLTLGSIRHWLRDKQFLSIGVASFGPVDCKIGSPTFGFITSTPKPNWGNTDVLSLLGIYDEHQSVPFKFDTDVNAPAMAEYCMHSNSALSSCAYVTVGTGIGVGLVVNGKTVHGLMHPEGGHIQVARKRMDVFEGTCPFHGSCVEGMCSTGALAKRKGCLPDELPTLTDDDELWDTCAYYLAQLCANLILTVSVERIVMGGGVLNREILYKKIREQTINILQGYVQQEAITTELIDSYITASQWGSDAGIMGAAYLSKNAWNEGRAES